MVKPPVLLLPRPGGRFILYCDTSKMHTGSSLWQMQDGKPRLLGYASKSLLDACQNYSVTELEMTGFSYKHSPMETSISPLPASLTRCDHPQSDH